MRARSRTAIKRAGRLAQTARDLEHAPDRLTGICERVISAMTGELKKIDYEHVGLYQEEIV